MVTLAGSGESLDSAAEKLKELCHFQVSNDVIRRVCNEEGEEAADRAGVAAGAGDCPGRLDRIPEPQPRQPLVSHPPGPRPSDRVGACRRNVQKQDRETTETEQSRMESAASSQHGGIAMPALQQTMEVLLGIQAPSALSHF